MSESSPASADLEHWRELLARVYGGRRWILALDVLVGARGMVRDLKRLGAEATLCIAATRGTGEAPDPELAPDPVVLGIEAPDLMSAMRKSLAALAGLPAEVVARVEAFDPEGTCRVIGTLFDDGRPVAGRRKYGARPESWQRLEDKTTVDALWDAVGTPRAPARVVALDDAGGLEEAVRSLDAGAGTVWAADNREGFHGGASYTRVVRSPRQAEEVRRFMATAADRVRVMPFLEGVPCSIHGFVFATETVVLRPCEMLVFRRPGRTDLLYGMAATYWDPPAADREVMRRLARRVGDHLRRTVGYRGAFTVDGVLTADGFLPTELNPRFGAALGMINRAVDLPLMLLNLALVEREPFEWQPRRLERALVTAADAERAGGTMAMVHRPVEDETEADLVWAGGDFRRAGEGETADATAVLGPAAFGGFLRVDLLPERTPVGPSAAPRAAAALRWADTAWELGIGELEPAPDVRAAAAR